MVLGSFHFGMLLDTAVGRPCGRSFQVTRSMAMLVGKTSGACPSTGLSVTAHIRAHSTILAFQSLNYTLLYTYTHMETLQIYQQIPDMIPIIIFEGSELEKCIARNDTTEAETDDGSLPGLWQKPDRIGCIKREGFEEGIPIWKSFAFHFWQHPASPIGQNWTLSPEDYEIWQPGRGNNYLGEVLPRCQLTLRILDRRSVYAGPGILREGTPSVDTG